MGLDEKPARRKGRVTPWTTAAAVSTCRRRAEPSTAVVSSSSAAVLSCSCCASMYQTSARSRGWWSELALHRPTSVDLRAPSRSGAEKAAGSLRADVPGSRTHPAPPLVASCRCSVCSRCCSQLSRTPCTGGGAPLSGAFAAAALLLTAFVAWELRSSHPMLDPASSGYRRFGTGSATITVIFFVATRDDGPAQVRVPASSSQAMLAALGAACRLRAGTKPSDPCAGVRVVDGGCGVRGLGECGS